MIGKLLCWLGKHDIVKLAVPTSRHMIVILSCNRNGCEWMIHNKTGCNYYGPGEK